MLLALAHRQQDDGLVESARENPFVRGWWLVIGSIVVLVGAYAGDRWLEGIRLDVRLYAGSQGTAALGLAGSLGTRLALLVALAVIAVATRGSPRWVPITLLAIGALVGIAPTPLFFLQAGLPGGPLVTAPSFTMPLFEGFGILLPWTAAGLAVIGIMNVAPTRGSVISASITLVAVVGGAVLLFAGSYLADELYQGLGRELASSFDAFPALMLTGLVSRLAVMAVFLALAVSAAMRQRSRNEGLALLAIGLVGFVVLPIVALQEPVTAGRPAESLATALGPSTIGRWMAGAILVVGAIAVLRPRADELAGQMPAASTVPEHEPT
jgi:hypothetical protein